MPFTSEQFFDVFASYNQSVFPIQWVLFALALTTVAIIFIRPGSSRPIAAVLALLWLWTGAVYHLYFFTAINRAAYLFATMFIIQSLVFLYFGVIRESLSFRLSTNAAGIAGVLMIVYALAIYPMLGYLLGHSYPRSPTFGAPCPTTIFTLGVLSFATKLPLHMLAIPVLWALIATTAAYLFGVYQDFGLTAAVASVIFLFIRRSEKHPALNN